MSGRDENDSDKAGEVEQRREFRGCGEGVAGPACDARDGQDELACRGGQKIERRCSSEAREGPEWSKRDVLSPDDKTSELTRVMDDDEPVHPGRVERRGRRQDGQKSQAARASPGAQRALVGGP